MRSRGWRVLRSSRVKPRVFKGRASLVLRRNRTLGRHEWLVVLATVAAVATAAVVAAEHGGDPVHIGVNGRQGRPGRFLSAHGGGGLGTPHLPVGKPGRKTVMLVVNSIMNLPFEREEPVEFHGVEFGDGDVADFGPGLVLEGVVVQELAPEQQGDGEHAIDLAAAGAVDLAGGQQAHAVGQVEKTQQDGGAGQTRRGQDLIDILPELRRDGRSWADTSSEVNIREVDLGDVQSIHSLGHLSHKVGHLIHLVIQMGGDASGGLFLLAGTVCCGSHHHILLVSRGGVLRGDRALHRGQLDVVSKGRQYGGVGSHGTEHGLRNLRTQPGMGSSSSSGPAMRHQVLLLLLLLRRRGCRRLWLVMQEVHRAGFGIAGGLGKLFDELTTVLGVTGREGRLPDHVERMFTLQTPDTSSMGRSGRQALKARNEERRHDGVRERGNATSFRTGR